MSNPLAPLADIARTQVGHHEDGDSNTGSQIAAYQAATVLGTPTHGNGWPWCCAFVDWCILHFIQEHRGILSCEDRRPQTASVEQFVDWAAKTGQLVIPHHKVPDPYTLQAGDIVAWHFPTGHHIGIVTGPQFLDSSKTLRFPTIEGNTSGTETGDQRNGGTVAEKVRGFASVMCFIRLAVKPA